MRKYRYRHRQIGVNLAASDVVQRLNACWEELLVEDNMTFTSTSDETKLKQQTAELVTAYLGQLRDELAPSAVETTLQEPLVDPFTGENLAIPLLGIVDLIVPGDGGAIVVDFKTAAKSGPPLEKVHEVQLAALKERLLEFIDYFSWTFAQPFRCTYTVRPTTAETVKRPAT